MPPKGWKKSKSVMPDVAVVEGADVMPEVQGYQPITDWQPEPPAPVVAPVNIDAPATLTLTDAELAPIRANIGKHAKAAAKLKKEALEAERRAHPEWDPEEPPPTTAPQVNAYDLSGAITKAAKDKARSQGFSSISGLRKVEGVWTFEAHK